MADSTSYIAFYGTLMEEQHAAIRKQIGSKLVLQGKCLIPGRIYSMGRYPALKISHNDHEVVSGELYKIKGDSPLKVLDDYESHDDYNKDLPGFTRRLV